MASWAEVCCFVALPPESDKSPHVRQELWGFGAVISTRVRRAGTQAEKTGMALVSAASPARSRISAIVLGASFASCAPGDTVRLMSAWLVLRKTRS